MASDQITIEYLEGLSRNRALGEQESLMLEAAVRRECRRTGITRPGWKPKEDEMVKDIFSKPVPRRDGAVTRQVLLIASAMGRTEQAIWSRVRQLRRAGEIGYCEIRALQGAE